jgi:hypothetical protein
LILGLCVAAALTAPMASAQKNEPSSAMSFTLDNTTGVSSDNQGPYIQGKGGVGAMIGSAGDFIGTFYHGSRRSLTINYASPVDPLNAPFSGVHVVDTAASRPPTDPLPGYRLYFGFERPIVVWGPRSPYSPAAGRERVPPGGGYVSIDVRV